MDSAAVTMKTSSRCHWIFGLRTSLTQPGGNYQTEFEAPPAVGLVREADATLEYEIFHAAIAEREAVVQPDATGDGMWVIAVLALGWGRCAHEQLLRHLPLSYLSSR